MGELQQREAQRLRFALAETNRELALLDDVAATQRWPKLERQRQQDKALDMASFFRPSEW